MPSGGRFYGATKQRLSYLTTMTRGVFVREKIRLSKLRTPAVVAAVKHGGGSMLLGAVLLPVALVHCTKLI